MQPATAPLFEIGCKFCGAQTDEGNQLCGKCLGLTEIPASSTDPQTCLTCGGPFSEYKIGPNWVREPIQCYTCLMRKKYGPDWKPGITKAQRKLIGNRSRRLARGVVAKKQPPVPDQPKPEVVAPEDCPTVALRFEGPDGAMYRRLFGIAHRERRTLDQQVLFMLDGVLGEVVSN